MSTHLLNQEWQQWSSSACGLCCKLMPAVCSAGCADRAVVSLVSCAGQCNHLCLAVAIARYHPHVSVSCCWNLLPELSYWAACSTAHDQLMRLLYLAPLLCKPGVVALVVRVLTPGTLLAGCCYSYAECLESSGAVLRTLTL
jgi:hypothetical protein